MGNAAKKMADGLPTGLLDIPSDEYHADRSAVSKGWLDRIDRSPAHLKAYLDAPHVVAADTPALLFGRLAHTAVLEPDLLHSEYAVPPSVDRRTKAGKEEYAAWQDEHKNMTPVTADQMAMAEAIRDSVMRHKAASVLLAKGSAEQTMVWHDSTTGEKCKARADWLRDGIIVDLKTTTDARPDAFAKAIANFRYDVQAAHYCDGFEAERFIFIAAEKEPPYGIAVYAADESIFERGHALRAANLDAYSRCMATKHWPAYEATIQTIQLPAWARG